MTTRCNNGLHVDIETKCEISIKDVGVHKYVRHVSFKIILFGYAWGDEPVKVIDCHNDEFPGQSIPDDILAALSDPNVTKYAHNAPFEMEALGEHYGIAIDPSQWVCTLVRSAYLGLPLALGEVAAVLNLADKKDTKGKALITWFCVPKKGTNEFRSPEQYPEKWAQFIRYCGQDVVVERGIEKYCCKYPPAPPEERRYWLDDVAMNNRGVRVDLDFIRVAIRINAAALADIHAAMVSLTGVANPNSKDQLKKWIGAELGAAMPSLSKDYLQDHVDFDLLPEHVAELIRLYQQSNKTSSSKFDTMLQMACDDGRIYGIIQYYGANRTGRAAGRGVQPQNLKLTPDNEKLRKQAPSLIDDILVIGKRAVLQGVAHLLFDNVTDLISRLVRTGFIAAPGKSLVVSDYAQIEARILPWLAGEEWALDTFRRDEDIYIAAAERMFKVKVEKGDPLRKKGKIGTLALGYQGWTGALIAMGALRDGLTEEELPVLAKTWRNENPKIVKLWKTLEDTARHVIRNRSKYTIKLPYTEITMLYDRDFLFIVLPSGRRLSYYKPGIGRNGQITYYGIKQKAGQPKIWQNQETYGGSLAENITQAVARDCLYYAKSKMEKYADELFYIMLTIHDEIVAEADDENAVLALDTMNEVMSIGAPWAKGLPLKGAGYISKFYKKD